MATSPKKKEKFKSMSSKEYLISWYESNIEQIKKSLHSAKTEIERQVYLFQLASWSFLANQLKGLPHG
jgi:hypothetical protein